MKSQIHENKENKLQQLSKNSITKLALILFTAGSLSAQDKKMSTSISVNMNSGSSSSEGVSKNFGLNPNIGANLFWGNIGAGLDVGTFNSNPEFDFAGYAQQSLGTVKRVMIPTDRETSRSTYFLVGPQYAIRKGKMNIILSTKAGITMNKMAEFKIEDEASSSVLASYKAPDDFVRNAFTIKPSLSIGYDLTKSISLTANAQFVKQTGQQDFATSYRDLSNVQITDLKGNPLRQPEITKNIVNAPVISSSTKGASEFMSFGLGLTYTIRASGKHFKDATISMSANKEDNSGTQTTEAVVVKSTDIEYKPQDIAVKSNDANIEYAYKPQKADGSVASPNSDSTPTPVPNQAQDFNTQRSNREKGSHINNPNSDSTPTPVPNQAQDFNNQRSNREKGSHINDPNSGSTPTPTPNQAQDFNNQRSNREKGSHINDPNSGSTPTPTPTPNQAQDFNNQRSNREKGSHINDPNSGSTPTPTPNQAQDFNNQRSNREKGSHINNSDDIEYAYKPQKLAVKDNSRSTSNENNSLKAKQKEAQGNLKSKITKKSKPIKFQKRAKKSEAKSNIK